MSTVKLFFFNITRSVSGLPSQFRKRHQSKQHLLRGDIFKIFGKGGEPYMGDLAFSGGT